MKRIFFVVLLLISVVTLVACASEEEYPNDGGRKVDDTVDDEIKDDNQDQLLELTLTELAMYDGKDGSKAYIAVAGKIYDVTDEWTNGSHNGVNAGGDVSEEILNAPHGESVLENLEQVGTLIDE